jgi:hypothetical protein
LYLFMSQRQPADCISRPENSKINFDKLMFHAAVRRHAEAIWARRRRLTKWKMDRRASLWPKNIEFLKQNQGNECSTWSYWSSGNEDIIFIKFDIWQKRPSYGSKCRCLNMSASAKFCRFWPITWANFNIFQWNYFYMIDRLEIHHPPYFWSIAAKMWILGQKNCQKWTKSPKSKSQLVIFPNRLRSNRFFSHQKFHVVEALTGIFCSIHQDHGVHFSRRIFGRRIN